MKFYNLIKVPVGIGDSVIEMNAILYSVLTWWVIFSNKCSRNDINKSFVQLDCSTFNIYTNISWDCDYYLFICFKMIIMTERQKACMFWNSQKFILTFISWYKHFKHKSLFLFNCCLPCLYSLPEKITSLIFLMKRPYIP